MTSGPPKFVEEVLEGDRSSGYWVELIDVTGNNRPDVISFGVGGGEVALFENPYSAKTDGKSFDRSWKKSIIDNVQRPVAMDQWSPDGRYKDFILATEFGQGPYAIDDNGGSLYYYRNPRNSPDNTEESWEKCFVGRVAGTHRVNLGHFTRKDRLQAIALPIAGCDGDPYSLIPVTLFTAPEEIREGSKWDASIISSDTFRVAHDMIVGKFDNKDSFHSVLISSMEGIVWLYFDGANWQKETLCIGVSRNVAIAQKKDKDAFWGCQNVAVGKLGDDSCAYIIVSGPFHGNVVLIYMKRGGYPNSLTDASWDEFYLHNFDSMIPVVDGSGAVHQVATADLDGDGDDEVLIASKKTGVYFARVVDIVSGSFQLTGISKAPALRISIADVNGDGSLDFASLGDPVDTATGHKPSTLNVYHNLKNRKIDLS